MAMGVKAIVALAPVLLIQRAPDHVAGPDFHFRATLTLYPPAPGRVAADSLKGFRMRRPLQERVRRRSYPSCSHRPCACGAVAFAPLLLTTFQ
jgi:hypothetical protein